MWKGQFSTRAACQWLRDVIIKRQSFFTVRVGSTLVSKRAWKTVILNWQVHACSIWNRLPMVKPLELYINGASTYFFFSSRYKNSYLRFYPLHTRRGNHRIKLETIKQSFVGKYAFNSGPTAKGGTSGAFHWLQWCLFFIKSKCSLLLSKDRCKRHFFEQRRRFFRSLTRKKNSLSLEWVSKKIAVWKSCRYLYQLSPTPQRGESRSRQNLPILPSFFSSFSNAKNRFPIPVV